jgi:hypothetical protein
MHQERIGQASAVECAVNGLSKPVSKNYWQSGLISAIYT